MTETDTELDFNAQQGSMPSQLPQQLQQELQPQLQPQPRLQLQEPDRNNKFWFFSEQYKAHRVVYHAAIAALVFVIVSLPFVYHYTGRVSKMALPKTELFADNCPTSAGKFVHSLIFFVLIYVICKIHNAYVPVQDAKSNALMAKHAFYASLVYFLLSSTDSYLLSRRLVEDAADAKGCPSVKGILLHSIMFLAVYLLVSQFPKDK